MSDDSGSYSTIKLKRQSSNYENLTKLTKDLHKISQNTKKKSENNDTLCVKAPGRNESINDESWIPDCINSYEINIELPLISARDVQLTGIYDDTQAFVIDEKHLTIIKKVSFMDSSKFVSGCSSCHNLGSDFLLFMEASSIYSSESSSALFICTHVNKSISLLLTNLKMWTRHTTENQVQETLHQNCNWQNESSFFVSSMCSRFCGLVSSNDGILLFELRNNNWKCATCKYQFANKCRHGQSMNFPEKIDGEYECLIEQDAVNTNTIDLLTSKRFSGTC